jgi:hypothetical protein
VSFSPPTDFATDVMYVCLAMFGVWTGSDGGDITVSRWVPLVRHSANALCIVYATTVSYFRRICLVCSCLPPPSTDTTDPQLSTNNTVAYLAPVPPGTVVPQQVRQ